MDNNNFNNGFYDPNMNNQQPVQPQQQYGQAPQFNQTPYGGQPQFGQQPYNQPQYNAYNTAPQQPTPGKGFAIASMVCGIVSLVLCCVWYLAIPLAIVAIVLGVIAAKKAKQGMATAGIATGCVSLGLWTLYFTIAFVSCAVCGGTVDSFYNEIYEDIYSDYDDYDEFYNDIYDDLY